MVAPERSRRSPRETLAAVPRQSMTASRPRSSTGSSSPATIMRRAPTSSAVRSSSWAGLPRQTRAAPSAMSARAMLLSSTARWAGSLRRRRPARCGPRASTSTVMSTSGWRRRRAAITSRVVVPEPITATRVAAAVPAQHGVDRGGQGHAEDAALVGDAVGGDEHLLVGEDALGPAAARGEATVRAGPIRLARSRFSQSSTSPGGAARAGREAADDAAGVGLDQHPLALAHPAGAVDLLDDTDHLAAGDHRQRARRPHRRQGPVGAEQTPGHAR